MGRSFRLLAAIAVLGALAPAALPQGAPNSVLLVADPSLTDPNFRQTVVLVTQAEDASTVGVILNRPTAVEAARFFGPEVSTRNYRDRVYFGGPVLPKQMVALFRSDTRPAAAAFHVLPGIYLSMQPELVAQLLADPDARYRLYAGFAGWRPYQLAGEFARNAWHVLPADADTLLRPDTAGLWQQLIVRARGERAQRAELIRRAEAR